LAESHKEKNAESLLPINIAVSRRCPLHNNISGQSKLAAEYVAVSQIVQSVNIAANHLK
jgi:hypothetical protein